MVDRDYRPIEDYAAIGDCHGAALVARDSDVDWCCLARFDGEPLLLRLLDARRGGFLATRAGQLRVTSRHYLPGTNVLQTVVVTETGRVRFTDFMPVGRRKGAGLHDYVTLEAPHWLVRCIDVVDGDIELATTLEASRGWSRARAAPAEIGTDLQLGADDRGWRGRERLPAGARRFIAIGAGTQHATARRIEALLSVTLAFWREWIGYCRYQGPYLEAVRRSALTLKLLSYAPSGAIAAAATTSLPEEIGGSRNWDYRYCWVRDASLTLFALSSLGYSGEATQFYRFLDQTAAQGPERLQVGYGLAMEAELPERELQELDGYRGSRPVRTGNDAFRQHQADLYAYVLDGALTYRMLGGHVSREEQARFAAIVDFVGGRWQRPDQGIWEPRDAPRHYVHSKAMSWVALDRGIRLLGARPGWLAQREQIRQSLFADGVTGGRWRRSYGDEEADAATLLLPTLGLPLPEKVTACTTAHIEQRLRTGDFVRRYRTQDGLAGDEGAFLCCSFWLVESLLASGRPLEATALFERLLKRANDVGLYAEQAAPANGAFLGNFPQALTHLALISGAISLALVQERGATALNGCGADRARRLTGATIGWRGVLAALLRPPHRLKLVASRESRYPAAATPAD